ncbi:hypothetical protein B0F88_1137 [Methylobacter tundripaludum]|uniref:Uncharacterized protein n=1 Tax=Methylobacter tundripaludum TaxID=173365 RepID=A0A2S6GQY8_9GAMM|nr:hypothetical protein B0F88_1137 [Methylobacter tundripaludum]
MEQLPRIIPENMIQYLLLNLEAIPLGGSKLMAFAVICVYYQN